MNLQPALTSEGHRVKTLPFRVSTATRQAVFALAATHDVDVSFLIRGAALTFEPAEGPARDREPKDAVLNVRFTAYDMDVITARASALSMKRGALLRAATSALLTEQPAPQPA